MKFSKANVLVKQNFKTKESLFAFIAKEALAQQITSSKQQVEKGFLSRENQGTTGFEDGFAIPHARIKGVKEPSVFVVTNNIKFENWTSLDQNGVQYTIALLIPDSDFTLHMEVLSKIATKLMDEGFRKKIKTQNQEEIFKLFSSFLKDAKLENKKIIKKLDKTKNSLVKSKKIIGISACPAGVAHTFMAKQKMENSAKELNYDISWETQGANGQKNKLSEKDIKEADVVIIASDIDINLKRFVGKKVLYTSTNDAIKNGTKLIQRSFQDAKIHSLDKDIHLHSTGKIRGFFRSYKKAFQSNFGKPWLYLFITASFLSLIQLIGFSIWEDWSETGLTHSKELFQIQEIAKFTLYLSMPFMAGTIAKTVTKKEDAFVIAFVGSLLINLSQISITFNSLTNPQSGQVSLFYDWNGLIPSQNLHGSNVLGAIVTTFITILAFNFFNKISLRLRNSKSFFLKKIEHNWIVRGAMVGSVLIITIFLLGLPLSFVSSKVTWFFFDYGNTHWWVRFLIGGFFGCLIAFDLGGFVNKSTLIALIGFAQYDLRFASIISIGIPICSLGLGTTFYFLKNKFKKEDAIDGKTAFRKGLNGISEAPLNLLHKYGWRVFLPNFFSSFISAGLVLVLGLYILNGGHINVLFLGAQAHLAQANDLSFLNVLLPRGKHILTILSSFTYGIIGYYLCMTIGCFTYFGVSAITFNLPGKKKVFVKVK